MAKKFDKISPKNISEEKFNQLVDALPSSIIEQPKTATKAEEKKQKVYKVKVKKPKSFIRSFEEILGQNSFIGHIVFVNVFL